MRILEIIGNEQRIVEMPDELAPYYKQWHKLCRELYGRKYDASPSKFLKKLDGLIYDKPTSH